MLEDLFGLFNSVLADLPNWDWFNYIISAACVFGIGCLFRFIIVKGD